MRKPGSIHFRVAPFRRRAALLCFKFEPTPRCFAQPQPTLCAFFSPQARSNLGTGAPYFAHAVWRHRGAGRARSPQAPAHCQRSVCCLRRAGSGRAEADLCAPNSRRQMPRSARPTTSSSSCAKTTTMSSAPRPTRFTTYVTVLRSVQQPRDSRQQGRLPRFMDRPG